MSTIIAVSKAKEQAVPVTSPAAMNRVVDLDLFSRPDEGPACSVALHVGSNRCRLTLRGVLGASSIAALTAKVDALGCAPCDHVVLDVSELLGIDAVGISVLTGLHHYVRGRGGRLDLFGAHGPVAAALAEAALAKDV